MQCDEQNAHEANGLRARFQAATQLEDLKPLLPELKEMLLAFLRWSYLCPEESPPANAMARVEMLGKVCVTAKDYLIAAERPHNKKAVNDLERRALLFHFRHGLPVLTLRHRTRAVPYFKAEALFTIVRYDWDLESMFMAEAQWHLLECTADLAAPDWEG